jgi:protein-tyrosine phosphatase
MPSVLFVCTGNQFRSPIAAAAFIERLNDEGGACLCKHGRQATGWRVESAGTWTVAGQPPLPAAIQAAASCGLSLEGHTARLVEASILSCADLILVMESGQKEAILSEFPNMGKKVFLLSEIAEGVAYDIPDPLVSEEDLSEEIAKEVCALVGKGFQRICELARRLSARPDVSLSL